MLILTNNFKLLLGLKFFIKNINKKCGAVDVSELSKKIVALKANIGFAFDGDGDRLIAVDEKGKQIDGDKIIALFANSLKMFGFGFSWGGFKSLLTARPYKRDGKWVHDGKHLVRLSIGLEDTDDLIADLKNSFIKLQ